MGTELLKNGDFNSPPSGDWYAKWPTGYPDPWTISGNGAADFDGFGGGQSYGLFQDVDRLIIGKNYFISIDISESTGTRVELLGFGTLLNWNFTGHWEGIRANGLDGIFQLHVATAAGGTLTITNVTCSGQIPKDLMVSPSYGPEAGGTEVTILGTDLDSVDGVEFGGIAATNFVLVSSTKITCTTPAHQRGKVDVALLSGTTTLATITEGFFYGTSEFFVPMVKRDSATNKIMTVAVNGKKKVQTITRPPCTSCVQFQPEELTVALSGFADCTGCINCAAKKPCWAKCVLYNRGGGMGAPACKRWDCVPFNSFKVDGLAESINDKEFVVKHLRGCVYQSTFVNEYGTLTFYKKEDCDDEGGVAVYSITRLTIYIADVGVNEETGDRRIQIVLSIWGVSPNKSYYSDCFLNIFSGYIIYNDFEDAVAWQLAYAYSIGGMVFHGEWAYKCYQPHTSAADNEPGVGNVWKDYWKYGRESCFEVADVAYNDFTSCCEGVSGATIWAGGHSYSIGDIVSNIVSAYSPPVEENRFFKSLQDHTSSADNEPGDGKHWWSYWRRTYPDVRPCGATGEVDILYEG